MAGAIVMDTLKKPGEHYFTGGAAWRWCRVQVERCPR